MSILTLIPGGKTATARRVVTLLVTLIAATAISVLPASAAAAGMGCTTDPDWATMKSAWATEVVALTNAHRATLGLRPLAPSDSLTDAAEWKAAHMAHFSYMSHDDPAPPVDRSWDQRIEDCGYTYGMGENIAYGYRTPAAVVAGWLGSTGHRENIENPDYRVIGVGAAVNEAGTAYWAQTFGTRLEADDVPTDPAPQGDPVDLESSSQPADVQSPVTGTRVQRPRSLSSMWRFGYCAARGGCGR